ncbi:MAG: hypothetical protein JSS46_14045 [Proteobacteria bacterium]|nr:hypothetical protein [Pseudomonadota bacterium]
MSVAVPARDAVGNSAASAPHAGGDPGVALVGVVESRLAATEALADHQDAARAMLAVAEDVLVDWVAGRGEAPTRATREGFRLLALHRQGAQDLPSFNACRETCREIAYHYNVLCFGDAAGTLAADEAARTRTMMGLLVRHLALFVGGKMHSARVGEFCCASRPLRQDD